MTLYLTSLWAKEEMEGLQEDKNIGKGKTRGMERKWEQKTQRERESSENFKECTGTECEGSGAEEEESEKKETLTGAMMKMPPRELQ